MIEIAPSRDKRINNTKYYYKIGKQLKIGFWRTSSMRWLCIHKREGSVCKKCHGYSLCEHKKKIKFCTRCRNLHLLAKTCALMDKHVV